MNSAGAKLLDASGPYELVGKSLLDFVHPDNKKLLCESFEILEKDGRELAPLEIEVPRKHGDTIFLEIAATHFTYKNRPAVHFTFHEITKRKKMEELIVQSRQDWEDTFHAITDMVTIHDKDFNIIYANKSARKMLRLPSIEGDKTIKCFKFYHGTECPPEGCPSCNCLTTGKPANFEIYEPHLKMFIEIRSMPRFDKDNNLIGLIHIARDVTARKHAEIEIEKAKDELELRVEERTSELREINEQLKEQIAERKTAVEALQKSEHKYKNLSNEFHTLLDGIPDNLLLVSPDLKILWANNAAASVFGKDPSELRNEYCYSLCCNVISPCDNCPTLKSFETGNEETAEIATSQDRIWDIRAFPIKDETGNIKTVIELARDITENVNLQADATRTRHLASIGELAAGVAHEINNPINNVINYAQILCDEFEEEGRDDEIARRIMKDGDRIATIVRSLLSFARIRKEEKTLTYLHELFSDTLSLTSAQLRKDAIELKIHIPEKTVRVNVHPQQIQQVFLNLVSNARYALNQKYPGSNDNKILDITCEEITMKNKSYIKIIFHDHGTGIPSSEIDKVINPFFSTKPNRIGSGLGLSISHGIITEHDGKFSINSVEGKYTKITISLESY
jgi:signal transduction histidine kinase